MRHDTPSLDLRVGSENLELNHLIEKKPMARNGDAFEYMITPYGMTLKKLIVQIEMWGIKHREKIMG